MPNTHLMLEQLQSFLRRYPPDKKGYLLAISGGLDSMVLAHLMLELGQSFALVHCNFKLRAQDSDDDEAFLNKWASSHQLTLYRKSFDCKAFAASQGISTQMAARHLRYDFFEQLMQEQQFGYLLTAHHADDVLETLLIKLGRGCGMEAMQGIPEASGNILRPLLPISKDELLTYAHDKKISWREDSSNASRDYQRNYLRHQVVPPLRQAFPSFDKSFARSRQQLADDWKLMEFLLDKELEQILIAGQGEVKISIQKLMNYPSPGSLLHHWLRRYENFDLPAILNACARPAGQLFSQGNYRLLADRKFLVLTTDPEENKDSFSVSATQSSLSSPVKLEISCIDAADFELRADPNLAALDYDRLQFPLTLRRWQAGDRFQPLGMEGHKKLSDFFIDIKLNRFEKERTWLLLSGSEIVWVLGQRISELFKVTEKTKTVYFARLK